MFKVVDAESGKEIIILDFLEDHGLEMLRQKGRSGQLKCPGCKQPMLVKAGEILRPHFAHRNLADCPSGHESLDLLQARALLYEWLKSKFAVGVTLEQRLTGAQELRAIDCWVDYKGRRFAYWIFERGLKRELRESLLQAVMAANADLNAVFLAGRMRRNNAPKNILNLPALEREFLRRSDYDRCYPGGQWASGSMHFLDAKGKTLLTFRAMHCSEGPQQFTGIELSTPLKNVLVSPANGEFVHPGEAERLNEFRQAEKTRKLAAQKAAREARARRERQKFEEPETPAKIHWSPSANSNYDHLNAASFRPVSALQTKEKEAPCVFCGKLILERDYWVFDGKTGQCKCKACLKNGRM
jgi:hypothetical protein